MAAIIGRREFLAGATALGLAPRLAWAGTATKRPHVQALFDGYVGSKQFAFASAALLAGSDAIDYVNAGTLAFDSRTPADENTLCRIHSMSKPLTAAAAMILIEDGKLSLDQPVADVFPSWKAMKVATSPDAGLDSRPARTIVTMRHLLTHSAGLSYGFLYKDKVAAAYDAHGISPGLNIPVGKAKPGDPQAHSLAEMMERLAELPLMFDPGTQWHYSIGLDVMGAVIEKVSGQGFDAFLRQRLFDPLDMASTGFVVAPKDYARFATLYQLTDKAQTVFDASPGAYAEKPQLLSGGGGMISSARDYVRFGQMLLGRGQLGSVRVMKEATAAVMMSNLLQNGVRDREGNGYGAGGRFILPGPTGRFGAPGSYGWGGHASTLFTVDPARRQLMVFMTQRMPSDKSPAPRELPAAIAADLAARPAA
jgi:CubicO group peptidase (beta-lactamase class C family)